MSPLCRLARLPVAALLCVALTSCQVKDAAPDSGGGARDAAPTRSDAGGATDGAADVGTSVDGSAPSADFLPIPAAGGQRVVVEGDGWGGYDRSCGSTTSADSAYSTQYERLYVLVDQTGCGDDARGNNVLQIARKGGLVPGVYDISSGGDVIGKVALNPPAPYATAESELTGKLWIRRAESLGSELVVEASYYGTGTLERAGGPPTAVTVRAALNARVRVAP